MGQFRYFVMARHTHNEAPNYTNACIVMFGVNIAWLFMVIWAIWGLVVVMLVGAFINHFMHRIEARSHARLAERRRNPRPRVRS